MLPLAFVIPFLLLALLPLPLFWFLFSPYKNLVCVIPFELPKVKDLVCLTLHGVPSTSNSVCQQQRFSP